MSPACQRSQAEETLGTDIPAANFSRQGELYVHQNSQPGERVNINRSGQGQEPKQPQAYQGPATGLGRSTLPGPRAAPSWTSGTRNTPCPMFTPPGLAHALRFFHPIRKEAQSHLVGDGDRKWEREKRENITTSFIHSTKCH